MSLAWVGPNQARPMLATVALLQKHTVFFPHTLLSETATKAEPFGPQHTHTARLWPGLRDRDHQGGINTCMLQPWWSVWFVSPPGWTSTCVWSTTATAMWRFAFWAWGLVCWARPWASCPSTLPWRGSRSLPAPLLFLALRCPAFSPATLQVNSQESVLYMEVPIAFFSSKSVCATSLLAGGGGDTPFLWLSVSLGCLSNWTGIFYFLFSVFLLSAFWLIWIGRLFIQQLYLVPTSIRYLKGHVLVLKYFKLKALNITQIQVKQFLSLTSLLYA